MKNSSMSSFDTPTTLQHEKEKANDFREKGDHVKPRTIEIKEAVTKQLESKPSQDINESNDFREKGDQVKPRTIEIKEAVTKQLESKPSQDINESAEAFIKKLRQQLLIQRLESIENYEQMLERGL
ncbi:hypothetical protein CFP56_042671 [Quercus suber]|uniref:Uncharacterized protein n=1 Tax=Quercus suber TaxID=58331 RepID=A0AAW0LK80_QUESU